MNRHVVRIGGTVAAVVALVLCVVVLADPFGEEESSARPADEATSSASARTPSIAPTPRVLGVRTPGTPTRIVIPTLSVDSAVVGIRSENRVLDPPVDPDVIGWWSEGVQPGAERGSALLTGHTVHTGAGALKDLEQLDAGDRVTVRTTEGRLDYAVEEVRVLTKGELEAQAEDLFDQTSEGRLVVITCEDWDGVAWQSNVIVTALPA